MSTTVERRAGTPDRLRALTAVAAVIAAIACGGYIASFTLYSDTPSNITVHEPLVVTINVLIALGLATVGLTLPLAATTVLPTWALLVASAAYVANAAFSWSMATAAAHFGPLVDEATYNSVGWLAFMVGVPKMLLGLVGFAALAVIGLRGRVMPRPLAALFALAGLASLMWPVPPGGLLSALAAVWLVSVLRKA